jgi:peptidoglycan/xylan/chitin deacetylase (PgdA/CDA1 family)
MCQWFPISRNLYRDKDKAKIFVDIQHSILRIRNYYRKSAGRFLFKRPFTVQTQRPLISFSFDDFPRTALFTGGAILQRYGLHATYYVSLGLLGKESPSGTLCNLNDLKMLIEQKHELGCHTYSHCHSWDTDPMEFENSVLKNREELQQMFPGLEFKTFAYPNSVPRPRSKAKVGRHFAACRGGGQTVNAGRIDLNDLSAVFIEKTRGNMQPIKELIDRNRDQPGWIIFATHDIASKPSPYGCTPDFYQEIVQYALKSGAHILPIARALDVLTCADSESKLEFQSDAVSLLATANQLIPKSGLALLEAESLEPDLNRLRIPS